MLNKKTGRPARLQALIMVFVLVAVLCGCGANNYSGENTDPVPAENTSSPESVKQSSDARIPQEEGEPDRMITVKAGADGTAKSAKLRISGEDMEETVDVSEIPFRVHVRYFLEGKELSAEEIAGVTGNVRMLFTYENLAKKTVSVDGEDVEATAPLAFVTVAALPDDRFYNVKVKGGKVSSMAGSHIAAGYALPQISDELGLKALKEKLKSTADALDTDSEDEEEKEIPQQVEISAYAKNFKLDFTATIVTGGLLSDSSEELFEDLSEAVDSLADLKTAGNRLSGGASSLKDGASDFSDGLAKYVEGVGSIDEGAKAVASGASQLSDGLAALQQAVSAAQAAGAPGMDSLKASVDALYAGASQLSAGASQLSAGTGELKTSGSALTEGYKGLQSGIDALQGGVSELNRKLLQKLGSLSEGELSASIRQLKAMRLAGEGMDTNYILETEKITLSK